MPHDQNRITEYEYNGDGRLRKLKAHNSFTGVQVTEWVYGATLAESAVASFDLVREKIYPNNTNPGPEDMVAYAYDRQGALTAMTDQNGTEHAYDYDGLGRFLHDRVTTLGSGIDGSVRRISRGYGPRGSLETVASYDNPTVGSGTVLDQVKRELNDFGLLAREYQVHGPAPITGSSPHVDYGYANGSENSVRREAITYPNGRSLSFDYGAAGSIDRMAGRVFQIKDNGINRVQYARRGVNSTVRIQYLEPGVEMSYLNQGTSGDRYPGLDQFDRIADIRWLKNGSDVDRFTYGFDGAGNRTFRHNATAPATGANAGWDELYSQDGLYQLAQLQRGTLTTGNTGIADPPRAKEDFGYDPTGNWLSYESVAGANSFSQNRTHNASNEITAITASVVAHDAAGNMTTMPKVGAWSVNQTLTWDAWNRLVKIVEGTTLIGQYRYDGFFRRIQKHSQESGAWTTRHFYYSDQWQILEERTGTTPERQFIWGLRYIDDLVLRDRLPVSSSSSGSSGSSSTSGSSASSSSSGGPVPFNERLYATHDQWHCTGLVTISGSIAMRLAYDAFGGAILLTGSYAPQSVTYDWETRFGSYHFDQESRLNAVRFRYLHSGLGRWVSRDPIRESGGIYLYTAAGNNFVNRIDNLGLFPNWLRDWGKALAGPGKVCVDCNCKDEDLSNYTYLAEKEPPTDEEKKKAVEEGKKRLRQVPQPGECVDADTLHLPGGAYKVKNGGKITLDCASGSPEPRGNTETYWKAGDPEPPVQDWPDKDIPPYPDVPPVPPLPPLDPKKPTPPPFGGNTSGGAW